MFKDDKLSGFISPAVKKAMKVVASQQGMSQGEVFAAAAVQYLEAQGKLPRAVQEMRCPHCAERSYITCSHMEQMLRAGSENVEQHSIALHRLLSERELSVIEGYRALDNTHKDLLHALISAGLGASGEASNNPGHAPSAGGDTTIDVGEHPRTTRKRVARGSGRDVYCF